MVLPGAERDDIQATVQNSGTTLRMETGVFRKALDDHPAFRPLLLPYVRLHRIQGARTTAC